jgi:hypothetical protein
MHFSFAAIDVVHLVGVTIWPAVALTVVLVLLMTKVGGSFLSGFSRRLTHVKGFGVELELTAEVATKIRDDIENVFANYREIIQREFDRLVRVHSVDDRLQSLIDRHVVGHLNINTRMSYRCTIHVPDVLFQEAMYQLIDYYPKGTGRGRTFSTRFGMIGMTWRLRESQVHGDVNPAPRELMKDWGMTRKEAAAAGQERKSFACVILQSGGTDVGVLYLDAKTEYAFGRNKVEQDYFCNRLAADARAVGLNNALGLVCKEIRERGPMLSIFDLR